MKIKKKKVISLPKKSIKRIYLEIKKSDIFYMKVDVPENENNSKENLMAVEMAWNVINDKSINNEKFRVGDGFEHRILRKEILRDNQKKEE